MAAQAGSKRSGRACPLCPCSSDINLFRDCEGVIHFDAEIPNGAFDLGMSEQKLDRPEIASPPVDQGRFVRRSECVPNSLGSSPTLPIHSDTSWAYWRVVTLRSGPRRPVNKNSPGRLPVDFR